MAATVIAAVDSSPASLQAARLLARYRGDRQRLAVVALHVQARPVTLWPGPAIDPGKVDQALLAQGELELASACGVLAEAGFAPEKAVRLGVPADTIAEEAMRRGAALIVMGTRGHGPLGGFALGSVALRVAHRAQAPTLLVQPATRAARRAAARGWNSLPTTRGRGEAAGEIVRLAGELGSELIVMGTRGLGAVHHALIGSVALKVAQASAVPVVLVP